MGKKKDSPTIGYWYSFGIHMGIGRGPVDELVEVRVGDRTIDFAALPPTVAAYGGSGDYGGSGGDGSSGSTGADSGTGGTNGSAGDGAGSGPGDTGGDGSDGSGGATALGDFGDMLSLGNFGAPSVAWTEPLPTSDTSGYDGSGGFSMVNGQQVGPLTGNASIAINQRELFGGTNGEGGIEGTLEVMMGGSGQTASGGLLGMLGGPLPGYRRMFTVFYNGKVSAMSPYPKAWKFRVRRIFQGWEGDAPWYPERALVKLSRPTAAGEVRSSPDIIAMNPSHIILESLTNREWGRGLDVSRLNTAAFMDCANALYAERFGMCLRWARRDTLSAFIQSVLDHIGGVLYTDRATALLTLKLIRGDYDPASLPLFDADSGLLSIDEAVVSALAPSVNEVQVSYRDPITNTDKSVSVQNLASMQASGGAFNSLKKTYTGLPTPDLALRVAQRDLKANALGVRRFKLTLDRRAWRIPPAGVFRIRDRSRGIDDMVVRAGRIEDGTLTSGKIVITALQDIFSFPLTSFTGIEPPRWSPPDNKPILKRHRVFEIPYTSLNQAMRPADFNLLAPDTGYMGSVVEKPSPLSNGYYLAVKNSHSTPDDIPVE